jgi:hypothetical protein
MKTSEKEGVSDRPPNDGDLPRCEAPQLNGVRLASVRRIWTLFKSVRILALLPLCSPAVDAERYVIAIAVGINTMVTNRLPNHRPSSLRSLTT